MVALRCHTCLSVVAPEGACPSRNLKYLIWRRFTDPLAAVPIARLLHGMPCPTTTNRFSPRLCRTGRGNPLPLDLHARRGLAHPSHGPARCPPGR